MFPKVHLIYLLVLLVATLKISLARPFTENGENDASSFWDDNLSSSEEVENSRRQSEETTGQDQMTTEAPKEMEDKSKTPMEEKSTEEATMEESTNPENQATEEESPKENESQDKPPEDSKPEEDTKEGESPEAEKTMEPGPEMENNPEEMKPEDSKPEGGEMPEEEVTKEGESPEAEKTMEPGPEMENNPDEMKPEDSKPGEHEMPKEEDTKVGESPGAEKTMEPGPEMENNPEEMKPEDSKPEGGEIPEEEDTKEGESPEAEKTMEPGPEMGNNPNEMKPEDSKPKDEKLPKEEVTKEGESPEGEKTTEPGSEMENNPDEMKPGDSKPENDEMPKEESPEAEKTTEQNPGMETNPGEMKPENDGMQKTAKDDKADGKLPGEDPGMMMNRPETEMKGMEPENVKPTEEQNGEQGAKDPESNPEQDSKGKKGDGLSEKKDVEVTTESSGMQEVKPGEGPAMDMGENMAKVEPDDLPDDKSQNEENKLDGKKPSLQNKDELEPIGETAANKNQSKEVGTGSPAGEDNLVNESPVTQVNNDTTLPLPVNQTEGRPPSNETLNPDQPTLSTDALPPSLLCSPEELATEDAQRGECLKAADDKFQQAKSVAKPSYGRDLCELISNKANHCITTFNQKCSSPGQILDYQIGFLQRTYDQLRQTDVANVDGQTFFRKCLVFRNFETKYLNLVAGTNVCSYDNFQQAMATTNQCYANIEEVRNNKLKSALSLGLGQEQSRPLVRVALCEAHAGYTTCENMIGPCLSEAMSKERLLKNDSTRREIETTLRDKNGLTFSFDECQKSS